MGKSQVTVFIILGMLVIAVSTMLIYIESVNKEHVEVEVEEKYELKSSLQPVEMYVETCLEQAAEKPVQIIGKKGGEFRAERATFYDKEKFRHLCIQKGDDECVNSVLKRREIEKRLAERIENNAKQCINLDIFRKQGYKIEEGDLDVEVIIGLEKIEVKGDYPLLFKKNNTNMKISTFSSRIHEPLGKLYILATDIINREISEHSFDHVDFMRQDGAEVLIEKHKPYPDTVYSLSKDNYTFNFALEGKDTVSNVGYDSFSSGERRHGCCYVEYDNNCYKNVPRILCEEKQGLYDPNSACKCPVVEPAGKNECVGGECNDCKNTYNPQTGEYNGEREHGESWCSYGVVTGDGEDPAGARHYLHYCIDGNEYFTGCRGYREELCTQETINFNEKNITRGVCRPNRWQSCQACDSEECCENSNYRDCTWKNDLEKCVPEVPPGFKFWEGNGASVCAAGSSQKECEGFGCGSEWVTSAAEKCFNYGDCGNYKNINGEVTEEGFYDTDVRSEVDNNIYNTADNVQPLDLDTDAFGDAELLRESQNKKNDLTSIMSSAYSFMDSLTKMSLSDVEKGDVSNLQVKTTGICGVWKAPKDGQCSKCKEIFGPCTEYRCKSLGKSCIYEEKKGEGFCHAPVEEDLKAPEIYFNESLLDGVSVEETSLVFNGNKIKGYRIKEGLQPFDILKFGINTDQETICKMGYLPRNSVLSMDGHYVGEGFGREHEISFPVPPRPRFPQKVLDFMNSSNTTEFLNKVRGKVISSPQNSSIRKVFSVILGQDAFGESSTGFVKLFTSGLDIYREASKLLLSKIEDGGYYLFFSCENKAGVYNKEQFFLEVDINNQTSDSSAPGIRGVEPENNSRIASDAEKVQAEFYMDEPSTCRFSLNEKDYEDMNNTMNCAESRYDITGEHGGSYLCRATIPAENDSIKVHLKCKDNPVSLKEVDFDLKRVDRNISSLVVSEAKTYEFGADNLTIDYYTSEEKECSLTYTGGFKEESNCTVANDMEFGQYKCSFDVNATNKTNMSVNILCSENLDTERNEGSYEYVLKRSKELEIIDYGPKGDIETKNPLLYVETSDSKNVKCGYYRELNLGTVMMDNMAENKYSTILENVSEGSQEYHVTCRDDYGNRMNKEIDFYVKG